MICLTHWNEQTRPYHIIIFAVAHLMHIYVIASLFLFCIITYITASIFNSIYKSAKELNDHKAELSIPKIWDKLLMWKRCHQLSCRTVAAIDHCFGWILFLTFCSFFWQFIVMGYWIFNSIIDFKNSIASKNFVYFSFMSYILAILSMICFPVGYLHSQVFA